MDNIDDKLKTYRNSLESAKTKVAQLQGSVGNLVHRLNEELGITSIEEAKKKREELSVQKQEYSGKIEAIIKKIEAQYDFGD